MWPFCFTAAEANRQSGFDKIVRNNFGQRSHATLARAASARASPKDGASINTMVASARKSRVQTGLIRRTLTLFRKKQHGNAEGWRRANLFRPVETHRLAEEINLYAL